MPEIIDNTRNRSPLIG